MVHLKNSENLLWSGKADVFKNAEEASKSLTTGKLNFQDGMKEYEFNGCEMILQRLES